MQSLQALEKDPAKATSVDRIWGHWGLSDYLWKPLEMAEKEEGH